jgi:hypothetical protein
MPLGVLAALIARVCRRQPRLHEISSKVTVLLQANSTKRNTRDIETRVYLQLRLRSELRCRCASWSVYSSRCRGSIAASNGVILTPEE